MSESLSSWLALRERADFAARSASLADLIAADLVGPIRILDLGTGTGSNIRYLVPRLGKDQHWLAVDKDLRLLMEVAERTAALGHVQVGTRALDLNDPRRPEMFEGRHLVTASALLDLVSETWLRGVASECRRVGARALFALTYNGRNECTPRDADDAQVFEWFNEHQRTDKGLGGPAAGPRATEIARRCFLDERFDVRVEPSDWHIGSDERAFQEELIAGWASAASEIAPQARERIAAWRQRRLAHLAAGSSRIIVGHYDLAAIPIADREEPTTIG